MDTLNPVIVKMRNYLKRETRTKLASELGVSSSMVSEILNGNYRSRMQHIRVQRFCEVLGVKPEHVWALAENTEGSSENHPN